MLDESDATLEENSATEDGGSDVNWETRFKDTQAAYTKNQQALADEQRVWEDEQALLARVQERFPHLMAEGEEKTEDEDDFEDDAPDPSQFVTRKEFEDFQAWKKDLDGERSEAQFDRDLNAEIDLTEIEDEAVAARVHDWIHDRTLSLQLRVGDGRKALKQAVEEYRAITDGVAKKKSRPKAPHVPKGGQPGTGVKDFSQMSRSEIDEWMVERVRASET